MDYRLIGTHEDCYLLVLILLNDFTQSLPKPPKKGGESPNGVLGKEEQADRRGHLSLFGGVILIGNDYLTGFS